MNIQKIREYLKILLLLTIVGCSGSKTMNVVEIHKAVEYYEDGYEYSNEPTIEHEGKYYSLRQKAFYDETGSIEKLISYKPEGELVYSKNDLVNDKNLVEYFGFPFTQEWYYQNKKLVMDYESLIVSKDSNSLIQKTAKGVMLYVVR